MIADYHIHTEYSDDSDTPIEEAIKRAIALGLDEICFTEHIDYGVKTDENCDCEAYFARLQQMKALYQDKIAVKAGMEFGMQTITIQSFQETFDRYPFDFIILSCHQVDNQEFWRYEVQQGRSQKEYNEIYYTEIRDVIKQYKDFSVLGHLDMIRRYDKQGDYPFAMVKPIVEEILQIVIENQKGIEINTSSFKYGLPDWTPSREILRLYQEMGGEIITIGSDAHVAAEIGTKIPWMQKELKAMGFRHVYTFERMQPVAHPL